MNVFPVFPVAEDQACGWLDAGHHRGCGSLSGQHLDGPRGLRGGSNSTPALNSAPSSPLGPSAALASGAASAPPSRAAASGVSGPATCRPHYHPRVPPLGVSCSRRRPLCLMSCCPLLCYGPFPLSLGLYLQAFFFFSEKEKLRGHRLCLEEMENLTFLLRGTFLVSTQMICPGENVGFYAWECVGIALG